MPLDRGHRLRRLGLRHGHNVVPTMETHHDLKGQGIERVEHAHFLDVRRDMILRALGRLKRGRVVAHKGVFRSDEVQIVRVVHQRVNALRMCDGEIGIVDAHRGDVGFLSAFMVAGTDIDV